MANEKTTDNMTETTNENLTGLEHINMSRPVEFKDLDAIVDEAVKIIEGIQKKPLDKKSRRQLRDKYYENVKYGHMVDMKLQQSQKMAELTNYLTVWVYTLERILIEKNLLTEEELESLKLSISKSLMEPPVETTQDSVVTEKSKKESKKPKE